MTSLTVALAIAGGLILAALVAFNAWTSHRNAPRQPDAPESAPIAARTVPAILLISPLETAVVTLSRNSSGNF